MAGRIVYQWGPYVGWGCKRESSYFRRPEVGTTVSASALMYTAISRKVVGKNVHATIPKGNMRYAQYNVPHTVAVEPTFVAFV